MYTPLFRVLVLLVVMSSDHVSLGVTKKSVVKNQNKLVELLRISNLHFDRPLPPEVLTRLHPSHPHKKAYNQNGLEVISGTIDGYQMVALGLCRGKLVQLVGRSLPVGFKGGLAGLVKERLDPRLTSHLIKVADHPDGSFVVLENKEGVRKCQRQTQK